MSSFVDPYIDPATGILTNLIGATNYSDLQEAEANIVSIAELSLEKIPRTNDITEIQAIHRELFKNIYPWAGKFRTVDIRKGSEVFFLDKSRFDTGINYFFNKLAKYNFLKGLDKADFVAKLTELYDELNFIHPFREGNGRTQRAFWNRISKDAGYTLEWQKVVGEELNTASQLAREKQGFNMLRDIFTRITKQLS